VPGTVAVCADAAVIDVKAAKVTARRILTTISPNNDAVAYLKDCKRIRTASCDLAELGLANRRAKYCRPNWAPRTLSEVRMR
jgi:hypothetical protein